MFTLIFPTIDPVLVHLGPLKIRWYGLMYVLGFCASYYLVLFQIKRTQFDELRKNFENLNMILILSLIIGGRLGYVLFYNPLYYLNNPLEIPATWAGGMSFHGGCILLFLSGIIFCHIQKLNFWKAADIYIVTIPIGLGLGRLGNFINGELFGRQSDVPWAMVFPGGGSIARHPSQLYELLLEGVLLFLILWPLRMKPWHKNNKSWPHGSLFALFLILYGLFRIVVEFFREPDQHIGYYMQYFTMGQILSSLMVLTGIIIWTIRKKSC